MKKNLTDSDCVIFPHIPKCSGSSLKSQFENSSLKVYFDYDKPPHDMKFFSKECERRNCEADLLDFSAFNLVFGHFPIHRYNRENYKYITILRHPVDRAISNFFYWKNVVPESNKLALYRNPIITDIKDGRINFLDFVKTNKCTSIYSDYLGNIPPDKFLLVGFTKKYDYFLKKLSKIMDIELSADVRLRQSNKEHISSIEIDQAKSILSDEIAKYELFYNHWV